MKNPTINLKIFDHRYRQALLYAMIEGLKEGSAFLFSDDRDPNEIELELASAGLSGYHWVRKTVSSQGDPVYLIERHSQICGAGPKERS